jgi:hypothetical protein
LSDTPKSPPDKRLQSVKSHNVFGNSRKQPQMFRGGLHARVDTEARQSYADRS